MARNLVNEQAILELRSPAAIVDDHRIARRADLIRNNGDVRAGVPVLRPVVSDDVARLVVLGKLARRQGKPVRRKETPQRLDPAMFDMMLVSPEPTRVSCTSFWRSSPTER